MISFKILLIFIFLLSIGAIAFFIFAVIKIWQKITKPHIQAMMKVDQQILSQPTYYQNSNTQNNSNNVSQNEMKLLEKYRKLSEKSKQKLYDYADTLARRENE